MTGAPHSLLFACTRNAVRSPMAEALAKRWLGRRLYIDSAGVVSGALNPFAVAVMDELGLDIRAHNAKTFDQLSDGSFDLVIALSEDAHRRASAFARNAAVAVERWDVADPTLDEGSREQRLAAFRAARSDLERRIRGRFPQ